MQQQRGSPGMIPGPQAHSAGPYQCGPGWLMQGPQPHGTPLYGHLAGFGLGIVPRGMGYGPFSSRLYAAWPATATTLLAHSRASACERNASNIATRIS